MADHLDLPAIYINRFYVKVGDSVRLTFGETEGDVEDTRHRAAVVMSLDNAVELAHLILNLAEQAGPNPPIRSDLKAVN